jgi:HAD superfamily hydrolase (TIGR01509 family)
MLKAILWDVDGTLAETERDGHRVAFNHAFEAQGLPWRWDERRYGELLRVSGGRERLLHDMATRSDAPVLAAERLALARALHVRKTALYTMWLRQQRIGLRDGVALLIEQARRDGLRQAIVTTTSRANVEALLDLHFGAAWPRHFEALICGEDVRHKKPDPEAYEVVLSTLGLSPVEAVAIEDSPGGVAAARSAGVAVVVTRSHYFNDAPIDAATAIGPGLHTRQGWLPTPAPPLDGGGITVDDLRNWCAQMETVSHWP